MKEYDYLIVGAGLFGATVAQQLHEKGFKVLVLDRRSHIGGNIYTEFIDGIHIHKYGAHIFHTNNDSVWKYVNQFAAFNNFINSPIANFKGEIFSLPFNMYTFNKLWNVVTPGEAKRIIDNDCRASGILTPTNLEEQAISLVGKEIYEKLVKGYTEKQWGRLCCELPTFIIKRLPVRFSYNNNYFNAKYQGVPIAGYTQLVANMLAGVDIHLEEQFVKGRYACKKIIYSGSIDEYYNYCFGKLEYRSLRFQEEKVCGNFQGVAVVNYTDKDVPWTRIIEHKWFDTMCNDNENGISIISKEYPVVWRCGETEPYYPINDEKNNLLYGQYAELANKDKNIIFGGRLGAYMYYDMDQVIERALHVVEEIMSDNGF